MRGAEPSSEVGGRLEAQGQDAGSPRGGLAGTRGSPDEDFDWHSGHKEGEEDMGDGDSLTCTTDGD